MYRVMGDSDEGNNKFNLVNSMKEGRSDNESLGAARDHKRNESGYSNNYSLLEIYEGDLPNEEGEMTSNDNERDVEGALGAADEREASTKADLGVSTNIEKDPVCHVRAIEDSNFDKLLASNYDNYGFKKESSLYNVSREEFNKWQVGYLQYSLKRKKKWKVIMKNNGLSAELESGSPTRFPPRSDKIKKMIRRGIPAEWRGNAWFFYAGGYEKLNKNRGIYEQIVADTKSIHNRDTEIIERDLNRTFPDNIYFNAQLETPDVSGSRDLLQRKETPAIKALRRILVAFAHYQPQVGYCQSLNFLAGLLLLFLDEEKAFWMLVILTEKIIPKVHATDLEGVHTDQGVLMLCIKEYIPHIWTYIGRNFDGDMLTDDKILSRLPPVTLVTSSWFMSLFIGTLPIETVLRIWDILWYEGSKTIFRIALTLCNMCFDSPMFQNSKLHGSKASEIEQIDLFQLMQVFPKSVIDANFLIDSCFKKINGYGFGSLSQEEINKCREFVAREKKKLGKKKAIATEMSEEERRTLLTSSSALNLDDSQIHDVYGFHKSLMSGVMWNKHISNKMKKRLAKKSAS